MFIKKTLQELHDMYAQGTRVVLREEGNNFESICVFQDSATSHDISRLLEKYPDMPKDYLEFLSVTNGLAPFTETDFFGGGDIYRINSVIEFNAPIKHPTRVSVAYISDDYIIIDLDDVRSGKSEYMYVLESISDYDDARSLYCDFQTWFDRYIMAQGNKYWTWRVEDRKF
ncbi:SMI1/KNR4 family protein [Paenibacillus agilis]|uniref:Knr4/Smi1-like domain-containing protein n=1 Tax=Paenibacillus agilis TaxID=3020863 RepID=A0A559IE84_9BACL|nr:SMI1/KNR4 family protein [Paenibacillus agilis]TVX85955.1 hypothetical protein FPZ44_23670 [Paenibacillus agilis]